MNGAIGHFFNSKAGAADKQMVLKLFKTGFHTYSQWDSYFTKYIPGYNVDTLLQKGAASWEVGHFQALYVACWVFHPVEKGSYMLKLDGADANVRGGYSQLLGKKKLQSRISSHLSKQGASAHEGWAFLQGYDELLVQIEGQSPTSYLFLKCEGHPMDGAMNTVLHGLAWAKKYVTGTGKTASAAFQEYATQLSMVLESRAAENYSTTYEKLLKQLGLTGTQVTVATALDAMLTKCGLPKVPPLTRGDTVALGTAMTNTGGYIDQINANKGKMKKVDFTDKVVEELTTIGNRLKTASSHPEQYFNEVRVTASELSTALNNFQINAM